MSTRVMRHHHLQALADPHHVLVLAAPQQRGAGGQLHLPLHPPLGLGDVAADVAAGDVDVDVAGEEAVLVAQHRRPLQQPDVGELGERNLRPRASGARTCGRCCGRRRHCRARQSARRRDRRHRHQHPPEAIGVVAQLARVAHVDRVARAPLDGGGDVLAADGGGDHRLQVVDGEPVAGELIAPWHDVEEVAARHALGEDAAGAGHAAHSLGDLLAQPLDRRRPWSRRP